MREALPVGQQSPELVPMLVELMKFGVGGFKQAKAIEGTLDVALEQIKQILTGSISDAESYYLGRWTQEHRVV
jgi:hypothetical protein